MHMKTHINVNPSAVPVTNLSVSSTLQTPTKRWPLSSALEHKQPTTTQERQNYKPMHILPQEGVDAIVSIPMEETGQHILRVDISYGGPDPKAQPEQQNQQQSLDHQGNPQLQQQASSSSVTLVED